MIKCRFPHNDSETSLRHVTTVCILLKNNKILLTKRGYYKGKPMSEFGKWTLPGGYMDRDETLIQCIKREILEETDYTIKNLQLLRITDNPFRPGDDNQNICFIYTADIVSQKITKPDEETLEQQWFEMNSLPPKNKIAFDHADDLDFFIQVHNNTVTG